MVIDYRNSIMPTILELGIRGEDLPGRHVAGGTAVRDSVLGSDGSLRGLKYCGGGD